MREFVEAIRELFIFRVKSNGVGLSMGPHAIHPPDKYLLNLFPDISG